MQILITLNLIKIFQCSLFLITSIDKEKVVQMEKERREKYF